MALTGQTYSQGAASQCTQASGWETDCGSSGLPSKYRSTRSQCISRLRATCSFPTVGMLFSAWQAMVQAPQPMQRERSMAMPQRYSCWE